MFLQILVIAIVCLILSMNPITGKIYQSWTSDPYKSPLHFFRASGITIVLINISWLVAGFVLPLLGIVMPLSFRSLDIFIVIFVSLVITLTSNHFIKN